MFYFFLWILSPGLYKSFQQANRPLPDALAQKKFYQVMDLRTKCVLCLREEKHNHNDLNKQLVCPFSLCRNGNAKRLPAEDREFSGKQFSIGFQHHLRRLGKIFFYLFQRSALGINARNFLKPSDKPLAAFLINRCKFSFGHFGSISQITFHSTFTYFSKSPSPRRLETNWSLSTSPSNKRIMWRACSAV